MALIVQKFGGTSVGDVEKIKNVAKRVVRTKEAGNQVVVVVSAMGKTTDGLISLAKEINPRPEEREMDMLMSTGEQISAALLAMALHSVDVGAISLNGPQVGILTDSSHTKARILDIDGERIKKGGELEYVTHIPPEVVQLLQLHFADVLFVYPDLSLIGLEKAHHVLQRHRLPGPGLPYDRNGLPLMNLQRKPLQYPV